MASLVEPGGAGPEALLTRPVNLLHPPTGVGSTEDHPVQGTCNYTRVSVETGETCVRLNVDVRVTTCLHPYVVGPGRGVE